MLIDKPLEELRVYQGCSECPEDVDEYWDRSLAEMERLGVGYERTPAEFQLPGQAEFYHLYFTGVQGARIHCKLARPAERGGKRPAVLRFHGYSGDCGSFSSLAGYALQGFVIAAMDCRGQGGLSQDVGGVRGNTLRGHLMRGVDEESPDALYYRNVFLDCAQLARIVMAMEDVDGERVGATGGSQGGGLTLACAALTPKLNRAAFCYPFLCDYRRGWELDLSQSLGYQEIKYYFRHSDPRHEREKEVFTRLGYIDNKNLAHRIRARVMMFTGLMDTACPPSTQFAAYNHITSEKKVVIYPDFGHENLPDNDDLTMQFMAEMKA